MIGAQEITRSRGRTGLVRLARRLGYLGEPAALDLGDSALPAQLTVLGRHGAFRLIGCEVRGSVSALDVGRRVIRKLRRGGRAGVVWAWRRGRPELHVIAAAPGRTSTSEVRSLRIDRDHPGRTDVELLKTLAPKPRETAAELSIRIAMALDLGRVGREFYREFRSQRDRIAEALEGIPRHTERARRHRRALALLLLSRLVFLYFLQRQGWLAADPNFLRRRIEQARLSGERVFKTTLQTLFFGVLNTPVRKRVRAAKALGRIPYLNGGLFEKDGLERRYPSLDLPDVVVRGVFEALLDRYNFTVCEDRPDDPTTAIDPEVLGKVFEELMEADARKGAGAFYTPRYLVGEVIDESLRGFFESAGFPKVTELIDRPECAITWAPNEQERLLEALRGVRVLDPACGSGAFLLGALHRLLSLRRPLEPDRSGSDICRDIVRENLFGIDLDPEAVRLCELRLWLAIVAESAGDSIAPLPNLDHRVRVGDALLPPLPWGPEGAAVARRDPPLERLSKRYTTASGERKHHLQREIRRRERAWALELVEARLHENAQSARRRFAETRDLFGDRSTTRSDKTFLRRLRRERARLLTLRRRIHERGELPFFSFEVHFREIAARGGFDVVVGNPPWVRFGRIPRDVRGRLSERYDSIASATWSGGASMGGVSGGFGAQPDLAAAFVEAAGRMARESGEVGLLIPGKLIQSLSGGGVRRYLSSQQVRRLEDWSRSVEAIFRADAYPAALWFRRSQPDPSRIVLASCHVGNRTLRCHGRLDQIRLWPDDPASPWCLVPERRQRSLSSLRNSSRPIGRWRPGALGRGILTGANECFWLTASVTASSGRLSVEDKSGRRGLLEASRVRPALRGRDISAFRCEPGGFLVWTHGESESPLDRLPPLTERWLEPHRHRLRRRGSGNITPWWSLFRTRSARPCWRVVWNDVGRRLQAAVLPPGPVLLLNSVYFFEASSERQALILSAWLNSSPLRAMADAIAEPAKGGYRRFFSWVIGCLPSPPSELSRELARLGRAGRRGEDVQAELDAVVVRYGGAS
ncbi:MAG: hypothetical protein RL885_27160 [Planctomycetota bacterium]